MGSFKGGIDIDIQIDIEVDVDMDKYFGCSKWISKSVQLLLNGIHAVMGLTLIILT